MFKTSYRLENEIESITVIVKKVKLGQKVKTIRPGGLLSSVRLYFMTALQN